VAVLKLLAAGYVAVMNMPFPLSGSPSALATGEFVDAGYCARRR
jgi:hypothetical protein